MNLSNKFNLPEVSPIKLRSEADYYGTSDLVASRLGIPSPPVSNASWLHGWRFQNVKNVGELILPFNSHVKRHLVAKEIHTQFLKSKGYENVFTVGMPFAYFLEDSDLTDRSKKIPNSLLVMPPHTTKRVDSAPEEKKYINYIRENVSKDTFVCFCVHQDCEAKGYWVNELNEAGIPYVVGASLEDKNGILRMIEIYKHFEAMTTNTFGSHVLQASLCNLSVSVCGPMYKHSLSGAINSTHWIYKKDDIQSFKNLIHGYDHEVLLKDYPHLFCDIKDAVPHLDWAREESGYNKKVSFEELAVLLGWNEKLYNLIDYHTFRYMRLIKREIGYHLSRLSNKSA
ncbi:hypothetical protein [Dyadobacter tibetensis]|uniref:hypothetical protein n=1 Tax=Dyadobacter tibetensis TaxID=1211851 RepID=UPI00047011D2|nr:hypothetical protein [Dyadobacter tibetensis]